VLRTRGRLSLQEIARRPGGPEPYYPSLANDKSIIFLSRRKRPERAARRIGFRVVAWQDTTAESLEAQSLAPMPL